MSVNITLLVVMGVLFACGIYLLLERSLTRVLLGIMLLTNGINILLLNTGGFAGVAPLYEEDIPADAYNDPLPQALILTSIVISFAITAFLLGIIYRSWVLGRQDEVQDDIEDRRVAAQSNYDFEDDAEVPVETSEFSGPDSVSPASVSSAPVSAASAAEAEESPGSPPRQGRSQ